MSDEPEHRITKAPGRGVGPPAPLPEEAGDPLDDLLRTLRPPSRWRPGLWGWLRFGQAGAAVPTGSSALAGPGPRAGRGYGADGGIGPLPSGG